MSTRTLLLTLTLGSLSSTLAAGDWFVRAGAQGGDGSQAKPFADPWQALERCQAGDVVHIAGGKYFGKLGVGMWEIPFDRVELRGGYRDDFGARDPWASPTELLWDKDSKNKPNQGRLTSRAKDVVIDGIAIDMRDQNQYSDETQTGRTEKTGDPAIDLSHPATVRNCVVINPGMECLIARAGSRIENNLFVNAYVMAVKIVSGPEAKSLALIKNNTILFPADARAAGKGGYHGTAIYLSQGTNADIDGNILAHCDNSAVFCVTSPDRSSIRNNVFAMNLWGNLKLDKDGASAVVDDKTMELLEECGLKGFDGNEVINPGLPIDPEWMDLFSRRTAAQPGKLVMDDWNKARQLLGLPMMGTGYKSASGVAPAWKLDKALLLVTARKDSHKAGARASKLEVAIAAAGAAAGPTKNYTKSDITQWHSLPDTVNGKDLELLVAIAGVANINGIPAAYKKDEHAGVTLCDPDGKGNRVTGFYRKGTSVERLLNESVGFYSGSGKVERVFLARGIAYAVQNVPKAGFYIESIERYEPATAVAAVRPQGRDWFVRAGNTGGDGSKDKPFRDPFQALEKCQTGDSIHVAEGEYVGKVRAGRWKIEMPHIALLGGYDANFTERAPWTHPTRLLCPQDFKGTRGGVTLEGDSDHTGTIIDGFVFDKRLNNNYGPDLNLIDQFTDHSQHLTLNRPDCVVRNCIFVNGAEGAINVANGQLVENNVFMNHVGHAISIRGGHTPASITVRNNTILFNWERAGRFGAGRGYGGEGIAIESQVRATIDGNIVQFSDNNAIRFNADPKDVRLTNNVFAHNLWAILYKTENIVDDATFGMLGDFGLAASTGNRLLVPGIALDTAWFDLYLKRTAYVPGKVQMEDWNKLREILGEPLLATGGVAGSCRAPAYDWQKTLQMVPKNPECTAGARPFRVEAKFTGIVREEVAQEYTETPWNTAKRADTWAALDGKRVSIKVGIQSTDANFRLADIKKEDYDCYSIIGPEGIDGGLPMNCYVKRGTPADRALRNAKMGSRGAPEQLYVLSGVARQNRTLVVEAASRAD